MPRIADSARATAAIESRRPHRNRPIAPLPLRRATSAEGQPRHAEATVERVNDAVQKTQALLSNDFLLQVAIDGPAAAGKTTVAQAAARRLRVLYLDTGAMYRALAFLALKTGTDVDNGAALARLAEVQPVEVELDESSSLGFRIFAGDDELKESDLHAPDVTAIVSAIAAHAGVRTAMVEAQRRIAGRGPVVMAGRDIGTVVLPNAPVKIYLTASIAARVERRRLQLQQAGVNVESHRLAQEIEERDRLDATRAISPLAPAADAHVIDSSDIDAEQVVDRICEIARLAGR